MARITVDRKACIRCGACVDVCLAANVFELEEDSSNAVAPERCWGCGQCIAACPTDAIDHDAFPLEQCPIVEDGSMPSLDQLVTAFRARRSHRMFTDQPIPRELIRDLVSIGRWAPTASNKQALDWFAFDDPQRIRELSVATVNEIVRTVNFAKNPVTRPLVRLKAGKEMARELRWASPLSQKMKAASDGGLDPVFYQAPVVLVGHCAANNNFGRDDAIYAAYNIALAAEQNGLGSVQIGFFQVVVENSKRVTKLLNLPEGRAPQVAIALGYRKRTFRRLLPRRVPDLSWNPR